MHPCYISANNFRGRVNRGSRYSLSEIRELRCMVLTLPYINVNYRISTMPQNPPFSHGVGQLNEIIV